MSSKRKLPNFISKLWRLLQGSNNPDNLIHWTNSGRQFSKTVLPRYFKHSKFTSFVRQLNMYNFHKVKAGEFQFQFEHDLFRRGFKQLLFGIKRKPTESDLQFGKQLIRKANTKTQSEMVQIQKSLTNDQLAVKTEINFDSNQSSLQSIEKQNLKIKSENEILIHNLSQERSHTDLLVKKVSLLFQALRSANSTISFVNFKISQFIKHLQSPEPPLPILQDYLRFTAGKMIPPPGNIMWGTPLILPAHTFNGSAFYY